MRTVRNLPDRRPSATAVWALRFAVFTPIFAFAGIVAHRVGLVETPAFGNLIIATVALTVFTLLLIVIGLARLWTFGTMGGRRLIGAIMCVSFIAVPLAPGFYRMSALPGVTDVSTDLVTPPVFRREISEFGGRASAIVAGALEDGYSDLAGRRYNSPVDTILATAVATGEGLGWDEIRTRGRVGADDVISIEFEHVSLILGMPVDIVVRMTDEGDTTFIDVRSRSRFFDHDLGSNAERIVSYLDALDFALIGVAQP
ncbi:MAG: DUF1499 domain-containing protein [Pseudomonadota bacterium]